MFWRKPAIIAGFPIGVMLLFAFGAHLDLFHTTWYFDIIMHFLGGATVVITLGGVLWHLFFRHRMVSSLAMRGGLFAALVISSVLWECGEVVLGLTPNWTLSVGDTLSDMLYALSGGALTLHFMRMDG